MAGELILYATEDGDLVVRLQERNGSVWLTQLQLAELFQTTVSNINKHIGGILDDYEQDEATIEEYSIVQTEERSLVALPILSVGGALPGKVSARAATKKVSAEYDRWHKRAIRNAHRARIERLRWILSEAEATAFFQGEEDAHAAHGQTAGKKIARADMIPGRRGWRLEAARRGFAVEACAGGEGILARSEPHHSRLPRTSRDRPKAGTWPHRQADQLGDHGERCGLGQGGDEKSERRI